MIEKLGTYASGKNATLFAVKGRKIWFSYDTPIAFEDVNGDLVIRENDWNNTTGKHLNAINSDKSIRISGKEFESLYQSVGPQ